MEDTKDKLSVKTLEKEEQIEQSSTMEKGVAPDHDRVDPEIAKYISETGIEIDEATNKRLKRMIDKRVLTIMTFTYFLQALDKGTLSFSSIMHLPQDTGLVGQEVGCLVILVTFFFNMFP
jgi:hypothetical protein